MEPYQKLTKKFLEALRPLEDCKLIKNLYSAPGYGYEEIHMDFNDHLNEELSIYIYITNNLRIDIKICNPKNIDVSELASECVKISQSNIYTFVEEPYPMVYEFAEVIRKFILSHLTRPQPNEIKIEDYFNPLSIHYINKPMSDNQEKIKKFISSLSEEDKDKILESIYLATMNTFSNYIHCNDSNCDKKE